MRALFELSKESDDVYQMLCVGLGGEIAFVDRICIVFQLLPCLESKRHNQALISLNPLTNSCVVGVLHATKVDGGRARLSWQKIADELPEQLLLGGR